MLEHIPRLGLATSLLLSPLASAQVWFTRAQRVELPGVPLARGFPSVADLDGDGREDLISVTSSESLQVSFATPDGALGAPIPIVQASSRRLYYGLGDLDSDGDLDLVVSQLGSLSSFLNDGTGRFTPGPIGSSSATDALLELGDYDGDGRLDVALRYAAAIGSQIELLFGNGTGAFAGTTRVATPTPVGSFRACELDGAPGRELAIASGASVGVLRHQGQRSFAYVAGPNLTYTSSILQVVDFDGDGFDDLLLSGRRFDSYLPRHGAALVRGDGAGNFGPEAIVATSHAGPPFVWAANLNAHDPIDLWIDTQEASYALARTNTVVTQVPLAFPRSGIPFVVGDFDADGDADLVREADRSGEAELWRNEARYSLRIAFDEPAGDTLHDAAAGAANARRFRVLGSTRWQGDPGPGREAFRGNDPGTGVLARGSMAYVRTDPSSTEPPAGLPQPGSYTVAWWQRRGSNTPSSPLVLAELGWFTFLTSTPFSGDRLELRLQGASYRSASPIQGPDRWTHIALVVDEERGQFQIVIDGIGEPAIQRPALLPSLGGFRFGSLGAAANGALRASEFFDFDEFICVPRALSISEIVALQVPPALSVAPMGNGCFERRAEDGLHCRAHPLPRASIEVDLETSGVNGPAALLLLGVSSAQFGGSSLPLDLGFGCLLRSSIDAVVPMPTGGHANLRIPLPAAPAALQAHVYAQALLLAGGLQTTRAFDIALRY